MVLSDIAYSTGATTTGSINLLLDIYQPDATCTANRPTVLYVHGGAFVIGTKNGVGVTEMAEAMNDRGINFVSIQYRLTPDNPVPSPQFKAVTNDLEASGFLAEDAIRANAIASAFEDTVAALNFLRDNQDTYCLDTDRLAYWGSSAGAVTVLQVAYGLNQFDIDRPEPLVVVDYWGLLFRNSDLETGEAPFFVLHGTQDPTVDYQSALDITARAGEVSVPFALYSVVGAGHGFEATGTFTNAFEGDLLIDLTADFVEAHLRGGTPVYRDVNITP